MFSTSNCPWRSARWKLYDARGPIVAWVNVPPVPNVRARPTRTTPRSASAGPGRRRWALAAGEDRDLDPLTVQEVAQVAARAPECLPGWGSNSRPRCRRERGAREAFYPIPKRAIPDLSAVPESPVAAGVDFQLAGGEDALITRRDDRPSFGGNGPGQHVAEAGLGLPPEGAPHVAPRRRARRVDRGTGGAACRPAPGCRTARRTGRGRAGSARAAESPGT